jgi:AcrR family transcriptional regulator
MRQKDEEKKESIKQAVIKLILEQGFHGASIAKIAREAGVSPATVYIYYANKDDMLREIYEEYADQAYFYLLGIINSNMSGKELIDTMVRFFHDCCRAVVDEQQARSMLLERVSALKPALNKA